MWLFTDELKKRERVALRILGGKRYKADESFIGFSTESPRQIKAGRRLVLTRSVITCILMRRNTNSLNMLRITLAITRLGDSMY